MRKSIK